MDPILLIIVIAIAGPIIGSLIGVFKQPSKMALYQILSFTAGVMIAVAFIQLIPLAIDLSSMYVVMAGFALGSVFMYVLDRLLPHIHPEMCAQEQGGHLKKTATFLLVGIFLHNFPEGFAMGIGSIADFKLSLLIAITLAIHDIPEGIATAAPYYFCTKKRLKAFLLSASTAIPTVIGFLLSYTFYPLIPTQFVGLMIAATAGLMVYISVDELIPTSCFREVSHATIFAFLIGVLTVMLISTF